MKLRGGRFLYFFSLCDIKNKAVFLELELSSPRGVKQKKHKKKHEILVFKPLFQEIWLKKRSNWLGESFSEAPTSKPQNRKKYLLPKLAEMEQNWIMFTPLWFYPKSSMIHYVIAMWNSWEKIKSAIAHEWNHVPWLVKNGRALFSKLKRQISLSVSGEQVSRQASTWPLAFLSQIFKYFPAF